MYPENHGKKWDIYETNKLMKEIKLLNMNEIAKIHKRTENAIFLKLIREAARLADADKNLDLYDLSIITTLRVKTIINGFKKINYKKFDNDNNNDNDNDNDNNNNYKYTFIGIIIMLPVFFLMGYKLTNNFCFQPF